MKITIDSVLMCVGGAAASLLLLAGCASDKGYTVKGTVANMDKGIAVMTLVPDVRDSNSPQAAARSDTVKISGGKFTFKGVVPEAFYAGLVIVPEGGDTLKSSIILENAKITITANKDSIIDYTAYGMGKYLKTVEKGGPNVQASDRFNEMSAAMRNLREEDEHKREAVIADSILAFIAAYPDVEMCGYLAGISVTSPDLMTKVFDALTPRVQQCSMNCREMESRVFSDPKVLKHLRDDYVVCALYCDDKSELNQEDWVTNDRGKVLKTMGKVNSYYALKSYGVNAQPYYVLLGKGGKVLTNPRAYGLDVNEFVAFLEKGLEEYKKQ